MWSRHMSSPFRNDDGSFIKGANAEEARLHDNTLKGRAHHTAIRLPDVIADTINNNILRLTSPGRLRTKVADIYQSVQKEQLQSAPTNGIEANAHIAALFLQDYAHCYQVLQELKKRMGPSFSPKRILTVGYGPATGMVALNEVMGDTFNPEYKDAYVIGRENREMKKRAKIILSRQLNEQPFGEIALEEAEEVAETETEDALTEEQAPETPEYVGPVDTTRIEIRTKLRDSLPTAKKYDLIIVNHSLLTKEHHFPRDVDVNMHMLLRLLEPQGHIVLVERGNSVGFETVARARQIMIRPESFEKERGKVPRPYIKGSSIKPQKLRHVDQIITEEHIKHEEKLLEELDKELGQYHASDSDISELEQTIIEKYGDVSEDDLKFEFEDDKRFEVNELGDPTLGPESVDYHLEIVAPCSHHSKCPLQLGDPKYYKIPSHKHRLKFCSFDKVVERPKYTMELKRGKKLATAWDKGAEDGFGFDTMKKSQVKKLSGSGRPGGNNTESGSFTYLIARRASNEISDIQKIEYERVHNASSEVDLSNPTNWPRVLDVPARVKNNVKLTTCAPSGNIEIWQIPKSLGKQEYHDARKVDQGDLWGLGKKSVLVKNQLSEKVRDKLDILSKTQKKTFKKEQRKKVWKKLVSQSEHDFENDIVKFSDVMATNLEQTKKYRKQGQKFDVDVSEYDGK
ncbi:mitochondrial ribosome small subunit component [Yamadazyma tenuis ATCC 10573]|uniref:Mitochondrial ribosome small subunit component n=1 Tax=Candida tenuis (strain ATCC 10573 / BCRC 21748 / CBS 615 / JCM 9827 / NBRC 10315 / NRRL Y-1498 / VKM Y-70) TaxID=590646 RepID=G3AZB1_CANTC|nr:mitochondrial ribosome small subunit component [Yamadazyma tenuis ATCC 10573]EGV66053.1 mitochondrial ribosome small subunit component [Yamadazyma tenuis ATCC 10573]